MDRRVGFDRACVAAGRENVVVPSWVIEPSPPSWASAYGRPARILRWAGPLQSVRRCCETAAGCSEDTALKGPFAPRWGDQTGPGQDPSGCWLRALRGRYDGHSSKNAADAPSLSALRSGEAALWTSGLGWSGAAASDCWLLAKPNCFGLAEPPGDRRPR